MIERKKNAAEQITRQRFYTKDEQADIN